MNKIKQNAISDAPLISDSMKSFEVNIERFLSAAKSYGVPKGKLFKVHDLLFLQNIPKVTETIFELGALAAKDTNFKGPQLGDMPCELIDPRIRRRRSGMPQGINKFPFLLFSSLFFPFLFSISFSFLGDDLYVAHVDIRMLKTRMSLVEENGESRQA